MRGFWRYWWANSGPGNRGDGRAAAPGWKGGPRERNKAGAPGGFPGFFGEKNILRLEVRAEERFSITMGRRGPNQPPRAARFDALSEFSFFSNGAEKPILIWVANGQRPRAQRFSGLGNIAQYFPFGSSMM